MPGAFIINIGDLMAPWMNDRWVSTPHRVGQPATRRQGIDTAAILRLLPPAELGMPKIVGLKSCLAPGETARPVAGAFRPGSDAKVQVDREADGLWSGPRYSTRQIRSTFFAVLATRLAWIL